MDILTARKIADELFDASNGRIKEISTMPEVSLSVSSLSGIQGFINSYAKSKIGAEEILLLNGLASALASSLKYYAAGGITTNEKHVADTIADMMAKYAFLYPDYSAPCTVEQVLKICGEAISYGKTRSFSMGEHSLLSSRSDELSALNAILKGLDVKHCKNGICIATDRYSRKSKGFRNGKRYSVSFAYLKEGASFDNLIAFANDIALSKNTVSAFAANENELFLGLCERSKKLSLIAEKIPVATFIDEASDFTESEKIFYSISEFLFNRNPQKCAIAIISKPKKSSQKRLNALALKHGIEVYHPIEITKEPRVTVCSANKTLASLSSDIFRLVMRPQILDVGIPIQSKSVAYIPVEKAYNVNETAESVYMASILLYDNRESFGNCISAILSPFISAAYDGLNTKNSTFSVALSLKLSISDAGGSYAALLGIYRAITELGVTVEDSSVSLTDGEPSLSVALKAQTFGDITTLSTDLSPKDLFAFLAKEEKLPDFSAFLALINGQNP